MTANTSPIFTLTPVVGMAQIATANPNRDGSGSLATVLTGGADGTRVQRVTVKATGTTTAGMVRLYIGDNAGTPNVRLWREILVTAITASATVAAFEYTLELLAERAMILPSGYTLRASTEKAEGFNVIAEGGHY
jgi:hypothetical protein